MKKVFLIDYIVLTEFCFAQLNNSLPYCMPYFDVNYNMIQSVKIHGLSFDFGELGNYKKPNSYIYYNAISFSNFMKEDTVEFDINFYSTGDSEPVYFAVWIDYNRNSVFEQQEIVLQNANTKGILLTTAPAQPTSIHKKITVPSTAVAGKTRMRILRGQCDSNPYDVYNSSFRLQPCPSKGGNNSYGCAYDFDVNIINYSKKEAVLVPELKTLTNKLVINNKIVLNKPVVKKAPVKQIAKKQ